MRAVHPPPLLDQIEDRLLLPLQQPVHRAAARTAVIEAARLAQSLAPAVSAHVGEVKHPARSRVRPSITDGAVNQPQQLELGLGAHARGDRAEKPERCFPRCNVSSTANSFSASDRRSFSASAASSSTCSGDGGRPPGLADANAARAASRASCLIRITVLTSTPHLRAASACEISCEVTSRKISHFSSGESCRRLRGPPFSIITSSWSVARTAFQDWHDKRPNLYREVRRRRRVLARSRLQRAPLISRCRSARPCSAQPR